MATAPKTSNVTNMPAGPGKGKPGVKRAPENETPRDRFKRVASIRVGNLLDAFRLMGQMGPSSEYEYSAQDVQKIVDAIDKAKADMVEKLTSKKTNTAAAIGLFD